MHRISNRLNQIMEEQNISFRQLSKMSGVSHSTIYKIVNYQEDPRQSTMIKIAGALKLPVEEVFDLK